MHQLVYEGIKTRAQIELTHVPYRGGPPAMNDLLAGHVDISLTSLNQGIAHIKGREAQASRHCGWGRLPEFPDAPALSEVLPGLEAEAWTGVAAPQRTPREITGKVAEAIARVMQMADVRARLSELMFEPVAGTPDEMKETIRKDTQRWAPVISAAGIRVD